MSSSMMTVQDARNLLRQIATAKDGQELKRIISDNIMWCDGIFFSELDVMVQMFKDRGDTESAKKLKEVGDYMARLRFMI